MGEREIVRSIIDFSFIVKAQLRGNDTLLLRSLLNILISEAEDVLERIDTKRTEPAEEERQVVNS